MYQIGNLLDSFINIKSTVTYSQAFLFKFIFFCALAIKHFTEKKRGYPKVIGNGSFIYEKYILLNKRNIFLFKIYSVTFHLRIIISLSILFLPLSSFLLQLSAFTLIISYISEVFSLFRYHLIVILFLLFYVIIDSESLMTLTFFNKISLSETIEFKSLLYVKALTIIILLSSARRKIQYSFFNGRMITESINFSTSEKNRLFKDHFSSLTKKILIKIILPNAKFFSFTIIFLQITAALFLLIPSKITWIGCVLGIILQLGITTLFPRTLSFFTLIMISIYILLF